MSKIQSKTTFEIFNQYVSSLRIQQAELFDNECSIHIQIICLTETVSNDPCLYHKLFKIFIIIFLSYRLNTTKFRDDGILVALALQFVPGNADLIYSFMRSALGLKCPLKRP
jgi:hypothetical protein